MADPARLDDLLIRWEESREEGREVSVEQLCADCPELAGSLRKRVAMLKRMSWLEGPADDGEGDSVMELSDSSIAVEVQVSVPIEQFVAALSSSGLMSLEEIETYRNSLPNDETDTDASALATLLLQQGKLTEYQIDAIAEGKGNNLVLGDYVILDRIGAGGMGQVFKAEHRRMERIVALKMLPDSPTAFPDAVKRFQREVKAAAKLDHPNIVTAHDAGEAAGSHFLVMQYVEGQDLAYVLTQSGRLSLAQAVDFITQAAKGLEYAHARGVIHRDIKPSNLILAGDGTVKILDMGLARFDESAAIRKAAADEGLTGTGHIMGTAEFMAPEQAEDTRHADHRSDVYSLGCTLYRLLTGEPVYGGATPIQVFLAHRNSPIPSLREQRDDVPEKLDAIFQKMVAKAPEDRYQTVLTLLAELADCGIRYERKASSVPERDSGRLASPSVSTDAPLTAAHDTQRSARPQPESKTSRPNLVKTIGLAALLGFVAIAIIFLLRDGRQTIKVEIDPALVDDATVAVWLDGKQMEISGLGKTIKLKPGEHGYEIRRGDEVITVHKFTVLKGDNPALRISVEEGVAAAAANIEADGVEPHVARTHPRTSFLNGEWVDLLKDINLDEHYTEGPSRGPKKRQGTWRRTADGIATDAVVCSRIALPSPVQEESYRVYLKFRRIEQVVPKESAVWLMFQAGAGRRCSLCMDSNRLHLAGLTAADGKSLLENGTKAPCQLVDGHTYEVDGTIEVIGDMVRVAFYLDGKILTGWSGKKSTLSSPSWHIPPGDAKLGFGSNLGKTELLKAEIQLLDQSLVGHNEPPRPIRRRP